MLRRTPRSQGGFRLFDAEDLYSLTLRAPGAGTWEKIRELQEMEAELGRALRKCQSKLRRDEGTREKRCPVLDEIGGVKYED